jgi:hypothetical protein
VYLFSRATRRLKKKRQKKKKKTRSFICSFALAFDDDENKQNRNEEKQERTKSFGAQKKNEVGANSKNNFLLGEGAIRFSLSLFLPCLWAALS